MRKFLSIGACLLSLMGVAQENVLPEVEVTDRFGNTGLGKSITLTDSTSDFTLLSDQLQRQPEVYVKHYSLGSLATLSIRGTQAQHTDVVWNGISLRSPMLGLQDFSLFSAEWHDASLHVGSRALVYGSGNTGGALVLRSKMTTDQGAQLALNTGSFGQMGGRVKLRYGKNKLQAQTAISYRSARENFPFEIASFDTTFRMPNGQWHNFTAAQDVRFRYADSAYVDFHYMGTFAERNIPPVQHYAPFNAFPTTNQSDQMHTAVVEHFRMGQKWNHIQRLGVMLWDIHYRELESGISAPSLSQSYYAQTEHNRALEKTHWRVGLDLRYDLGKSSNYSESNTTVNVFSQIKWDFSSQWKGEGTVRWDYSFGQVYLPAASLGIEYTSKNQKWQQSVLLGRNLRLPTLNDRYWNPGGNPDLVPETSMSAEWNGRYEYDGPWRADLSAYWMEIENYILWLPAGNFFSPLNARKVRNRGVEGSMSYRKEHFDLRAGGAWNEALQVEAISESAGTAGNQVPYVPVGKLFLSGQFSWKGLVFRAAWNWNGTTYIQSDNSAYMPHFQTLDLALAFKKADWQFVLEVLNATDVSYYILPSRPMSGRNWTFTMRYQIPWKRK